jgi:DNA processing protein
VEESRYPKSLLDLTDPPPVIYCRGDVTAAEPPALAVVGSRSASEMGRGAAHTLASAAAVRGETIVSGLAFGIDTAGHRGALAVSGRTVAVLASGADVPSPRSQTRLYREIIDGGGAIVSEYLPGAPAKPYRFPVRNRLIAALSRRVLVVEAGERSGALHTVEHALALGRSVLAYPGEGLRESCRGSNRLIQDGAEVILEPADLLLEAEPSLWSEPEEGFGRTSDWATQHVHARDAVLANALAHGPLPVDALADRLAIDIGTLRGALTRLERTGLITFCAGVARWRGLERPRNHERTR